MFAPFAVFAPSFPAQMARFDRMIEARRVAEEEAIAAREIVRNGCDCRNCSAVRYIAIKRRMPAEFHA